MKMGSGAFSDLQEDEHLLRLFKYIERNPLRAKLEG